VTTWGDPMLSGTTGLWGLIEEKKKIKTKGKKSRGNHKTLSWGKRRRGAQKRGLATAKRGRGGG